jgi:hypothetical protein
VALLQDLIGPISTFDQNFCVQSGAAKFLCDRFKDLTHLIPVLFLRTSIHFIVDCSAGSAAIGITVSTTTSRSNFSSVRPLAITDRIHRSSRIGRVIYANQNPNRRLSSPIEIIE